MWDPLGWGGPLKWPPSAGPEVGSFVWHVSGTLLLELADCLGWSCSIPSHLDLTTNSLDSRLVSGDSCPPPLLPPCLHLPPLPPASPTMTGPFSYASSSSSSSPQLTQYTALPTSLESSPLTSGSGEKHLPPTPARSLGRSALPGRRRSRLRLPLLALGAVLGVAGLTTVVRSGDVGSSLHRLVVDRVGRDARGVPVVDFEAEELAAEWTCNPFKQPGRLLVDTENPVSIHRLPLHM